MFELEFLFRWLNLITYELVLPDEASTLNRSESWARLLLCRLNSRKIQISSCLPLKQILRFDGMNFIQSGTHPELDELAQDVRPENVLDTVEKHKVEISKPKSD